MTAITKPANREIIDDFAKEVSAKRRKTAKPSKSVINFRTDMKDGIERDIWRIPSDILRYRKDNGRIASDVMDYECNIGPLVETDNQAQAKLARFLIEKDPEKTAALRLSIMHAGQNEPTIITCDGFLINGNRRKMVMDLLHKEFSDNDDFAYLKCVILPGNEDEGGPPTILEIEKLENRYQLQSDGKSEYYGFDRALSIKRKVSVGLTLEQQLRDDPRYAGASATEMKKAIKKCEQDFILPLECVDRYLRQFNREGQYRTISAGVSDPQGRWQAMIDYSLAYTRYFSNPKKLIELGIEENEIGAIEEAAFDIIRLRVIPEMPKVHAIMRALPKYCSTREGKKEILKIADEVDPVLVSSECFDDQDNPLNTADIDVKWASKNKQAIIHRLRNASKRHESTRERETPLGLLEAALKKLKHENMDLKAINIKEYKTARALVVSIQERAHDLERELYQLQKQVVKLG